MKIKGSKLVVKALEDEGVRFAFGIPGARNIELYDALERSKVAPVLVTGEASAVFMADGVSRSSPSIGVANLVPGPGLTHAISGIAEAHADGIPLVVLCCAVPEDDDRAFRLSATDQLALLKPVTKDAFRPRDPADVYPAVRRAFQIARSGCPGPVAVEIPAECYALTAFEPEPRWAHAPVDVPAPSDSEVAEALRLLNTSKRPALYVGAGARDAVEPLIALAEKLQAPVVTTLQGKGVFPEDHRLWLWNGFGRTAPSFVRKVMDGRDLLLAVGCRFSEAATGGYDVNPPKNLIHVDISCEALGKNYPAKLSIVSDAKVFLEAVLAGARERPVDEPLREEISAGHFDLRKTRLAEKSDRVNPAALFDAVGKAAGEDAIFAADSGNGTYLAAENLILKAPGRFLAPVDYAAMGYAVPAAIGAKLASPEKDVVAVEGDGALLMTGTELLTASHRKAGVIVAVLRDGELGEVARIQRETLGREACSELPPFSVGDLAKLTGCGHFLLDEDGKAGEIVGKAFKLSREGKPVIIEAATDASQGTFFARGSAAAHFWRLPLGERLRMAVRLAARKFIDRKKKAASS